jgi:hypothetical protein
MSFRADFCFINPDYRLIRITVLPKLTGLARVYCTSLSADDDLKNILESK